MTMSRTYTVIYEPGANNWSAYVPDLPGCIATGSSRSDVERMIREAIEFHIQGLHIDGEPVPEPSVVASVVTIAEPTGSATP